jgi:hypothetical protein
MDTTKNVIEAHLSTGKTIPLRITTAKSGNLYWATLKAKKDGDKVYSPYGVNVPAEMVGDLDKITEITVEGVGKVKVSHDITQPYTNPKTKKVSKGGKARVTATREFTSDVDKERWEFTFRATLTSPATATASAVVNLQATLHRVSRGGGLQVQTEL